MPAERAALPPEYRLFYDALQDDGDWVLIEPYGQVFRPRVIFDAWQPYQNGFWAPSDVYGWVWISTEPFGWATYHYGRWGYDRFQGWVWIPDVYWVPSYVTWESSSNYVGWAPILDPGTNPADLPGDITQWAPIGSLNSTDLSTHLLSSSQVLHDGDAPRPIRNFAERNGVRFNRGPSFDAVERVTGFLPRVKLEPVNPLGKSGAPRGDTGAPSRDTDFAAQVSATRRAADNAMRQARSLASVGAPIPARVEIVRPALPTPVPPEIGARRPQGGGKAHADSTSR